MKKINKEWFVYALMRSVRTMAQTALGMFTVGAALHEVDWFNVLSVSFVAGIYSILTSMSTTLPETNEGDGIIYVDENGSLGSFRIHLENGMESIDGRDYVRFKVRQGEVEPTQDSNE